ncbi:hypothetical protein GWI33_008059 [Rhynchophorus ferrugineus]|uniref:Uncharacterized protein n=1 Tax=Rhynchophorus ferrugineus TaxID=354439 RepID=A0A834IF90_RHYFE|nr:hypothetical protein GWI33_008059 [Rhynchophorus ferrugineus]
MYTRRHDPEIVPGELFTVRSPFSPERAPGRNGCEIFSSAKVVERREELRELFGVVPDFYLEWRVVKVGGWAADSRKERRNLLNSPPSYLS